MVAVHSNRDRDTSWPRIFTQVLSTTRQFVCQAINRPRFHYWSRNCHVWIMSCDIIHCGPGRTNMGRHTCLAAEMCLVNNIFDVCNNDFGMLLYMVRWTFWNVKLAFCDMDSLCPCYLEPSVFSMVTMLTNQSRTTTVSHITTSTRTATLHY